MTHDLSNMSTNNRCTMVALYLETTTTLHCTFLQENNRVLTITNTNNSNHSYKKNLISSLTKTNFKRLSNHDILLYKNYFNDINNTKHKANITLNILNTFIPNYDNSRHSTAIHLRVTSSHTMLTISRYNP